MQSIIHSLQRAFHIHQNILDKKLSRRVMIYFLFILVFIIIDIFEIIMSGHTLLPVLEVVSAGIVVGLLFSRMFALSWDEDQQKITSRIDRIGGVLLGIYMIFMILRAKIIAEIFTHDSKIIILTFAAVVGLMVGRLIGIWGRILNIANKETSDDRLSGK